MEAVSAAFVSCIWVVGVCSVSRVDRSTIVVYLAFVLLVSVL